jgi:hypothetical protein
MIDLTVIVRLPWTTITYEYRGFKIIYENYQCGRIAHIYQDGQLRSFMGLRSGDRSAMDR